MLILILSVALIAFVTFLVMCVRESKKSRDSNALLVVLFMVLCIVIGFISLICIMVTCSFAIDVATESVLDKKIEMYQEENANIEADIDKIIKEYLLHEHDTFADLKTEESSITLITLFPNLKSDTLVQQQLELYVANNASLKALREEKIELGKKKWLLYFGK